MKNFIIFLFAIFSYECIQVEAFSPFSQIQGKAWDDAIKRLAELEGNVDKQCLEAYKQIEDTEFNFYLKQEQVTALSIYSINETTVIHLKQLDEWIKKAQEQKVDPSKCIGDRKTIEQDLPASTYRDMRVCWTKDEAWNDLNVALRNLTIIPNRVNDLDNKLHSCRQDNDTCINNIMKEIEEGFKVIPVDIQTYEQKVEEILKNVLIKSLESCIKVNLEKLKTTDDQLTNKAVQCIKDLINKFGKTKKNTSLV